MSNSNDFVITKRGILTKYKGPGGNVVIPEGVTKIGNMAFKGCTGLQSVAIPEGVRVINWRAFSGCTSLTSVVIPESVTKIDIPAAFLRTRSIGTERISATAGSTVFT